MTGLGNKEIMARNLSYYVKKSGKTQKELAEIVGVAASTFNDWTKAKKYPRIDKIEILASIFGILKSDLIENKVFEEDKKNNDAIADIIERMYVDSEFFSIVEILNQFEADNLSSVKQMLTAFYSAIAK